LRGVRTQESEGDDSEGVPLVELTGGEADARHEAAAEAAAAHAPRGAPSAGAGGASLLSRVLFLWVGPLLSAGRDRQLDMADLFELPLESSVDAVTAEFGERLRQEIARGEREHAEWCVQPPTHNLP
jgi:hypothetical protein